MTLKHIYASIHRKEIPAPSNRYLKNSLVEKQTVSQLIPHSMEDFIKRHNPGG